MDPEQSEFLELPEIDDLEIPPDPMDGALESIAQTQAQLGQALQHIADMQQQLGAAIMQGLQQVAQSQQQLAAAISAPRRRVPVRDQESGRILEAHDIPMQ